MRLEQIPMKGQWPDPKKVRCKDCVFRDKTVLHLGDKVIPTGVVDCYCKQFPKDTNGKPLEILFRNADCPFYKSD